MVLVKSSRGPSPSTNRQSIHSFNHHPTPTTVLYYRPGVVAGAVWDGSGGGAIACAPILVVSSGMCGWVGGAAGWGSTVVGSLHSRLHSTLEPAHLHHCVGREIVARDPNPLPPIHPARER